MNSVGREPVAVCIPARAQQGKAGGASEREGRIVERFVCGVILYEYQIL